jgi:para-nitrobenzyl esterase
MDELMYRFLGFFLLLIVGNIVVAEPVVSVDTGTAKGTSHNGVDQFLGLPYALPPLYEKRWAPPHKPAGWQGIRDASISPSRCPQTLKGLMAGSENEDCLYLNIYRPSQVSKKPRAIYLYVHGGGAVAGSANDMDGTALAREGDIIVITINYRLGALGFLNSEALAKQSSDNRAGNYALLDVRAALQWTQRNAAALGGDPHKITIGGESAGGTVICPIITSPENQGLFRSAIISSDDCLHDIDELQQARQRAANLIKKLGCEKNTVECLHRKTSLELISAGGFAAPTENPLTAFDLIAQKKWNPIPILIGANRDEGRIAGPSFQHFNRENFRMWLSTLVPSEHLDEIIRVYGNLYQHETNPYPYLISDLITDSGMRGFGGCTSLRVAQNMAIKNNVYYYEFSDPAPPFSTANFDFKFGSAHSAEISYLWLGPSQPHSDRFTRAQKQLSNQMIQYWANFIKNNNPNAKGLPEWPTVSSAQKYLSLEPGAASHARNIREFELQHHCDLWASMPWIMDRGEVTQ